ncbi:MAG: hypothetical protein WBR18_02370 [Anaerolineales bacterium]
MDKHTRALALALVASIALPACSGSLPEPTSPIVAQPTIESVPTVSVSIIEPTGTQPDPTQAAGSSYESIVYQDAAAGFEFDYPVGWTVGPVEQYSRGGITVLTSWARSTDVLPDTVPPGETRLDVTVQLWDPRGDLDAFVQQRMLAWDASGTQAAVQDEWNLTDGRAAKSYIITGADGAASYVFLSTVGDKYLTISGNGDLELVADIAHSVRPIPPGN